MLVMFLAMLVALLALPCIIVPETIWKTFNVGDDAIDYALNDVNLVALRNPVRENGPPVCMAKLIMLRHKINQAGHKKRKASPVTHVARHNTHFHTRSLSRTTTIAQRARAFSWMKFGKQAH